MTDIPIDDRGFTLGHGLFETVLWTGGDLAHWDAHVQRLERGCRTLGLPTPDRAGFHTAAMAAVADAGTPARAAVRLSWSAGSGGRGLDVPQPPTPRLSVIATAIDAVSGPVTLATARVRRNDRSPTSRLKTLSYLDNVLARAEARAAGADEALMLNTAGEIACAAAANVFWIRHDVVFTPDLDCGVLDGIVRREVIVACHHLGLQVEEVYANLGRLAGAPMFITNSLVGVRAVASLDGQALLTSRWVATLARAVRSGSK